MIVPAIIPARGGSKGIPGKNLVEVGGRPLLGHTLEHARATPEITEVVVSTDSDEIAAYSESLGATVVRRPPELSGDTASSESALLHALDTLRDRDGRDPDLVVFLQATSPVRPAGAVSRAIQVLLLDEADSLFSACPLHGFVWKLEASRPTALSYDHRHRPRRQELCQHVEENGSIYVFRPWVLRETGNRLGGRIAVHLMDPLYAVQVDEPRDVERVTRLLDITGGLEGEAGGVRRP